MALTGSNSHLGRALATRLRAAGATVVEWTSSPSPTQVAFRLEDDRPPPLDGIDVLVHAAWHRGREGEHHNVRGSERLLEAAARNAARVVFVSSLAAYDGTRSAYGRAKRQVEEAVAAIGGVSVRAGLIYGRDAGGMFASLAEQVAARRVVPVLRSPGRLQLVHLDDLSALLADLACGTVEHAGLIAAAHPAEHGLQDVVRTIAAAQGRHVWQLPVPWRAAHAALRAAELLGRDMPFRSDSVVSLARTPGSRPPAWVAGRMRPFEPGTALV